MTQDSLALRATLDKLAELDRYNHWIFEQIAEALGNRILEVGSGTGNITQFLCANGSEVMATDVSPVFRGILQRSFGEFPNVSVGAFDLTAKALAELRKSFDTIVCLNVLEHIEDDSYALEQMNEVLIPGGKLALLVPAHRILYGEFDRALGHYRRYEKSELTGKLKGAGFRICKMKFFSMVAALPWLINGRLLKRDYLPIGQADLANRLVPLLKLERLIGPPFGLSLIAIGEKSGV
ncbi:MAG: class I SAM-dependent methyltransferase [Blastocatellia bacterium]|nr:class I SAM-dependent methyltransferase [Blastocatellia bacterium]